MLLDNSFIVIEGTSCCGKTSILEEMKLLGYEVIAENGTMCNEFPPLATNYSESRRNERFILELEKKRCQMAREVTGVCFADRMLISSLAISYAWNFGSVKEFLQDVIDEMKNGGEAFCSDCTIYLNTSMQKIQERNKMRQNMLGDCWVSSNSINRQKYFYNLFFSTITTEKYLVLDTDEKTIQQITKEIEKIEIKKSVVDIEKRIREFENLITKL